MKEWKVGILLWGAVALIGSIVNGIIVYLIINNIPGFNSTYKDIIIITLLLFIPAILLTLPIIIGVKLFTKNTGSKKNLFIIMNSGTLGYAIVLTFIISYLTANLMEALTIISPYLVLTIFSLNYYLIILNRKKDAL